MENRFADKLETYGFLAEDENTVLRRATSNSKWFAARLDLIREGDRPGPVFVVLEGWACRYKVLPDGGRQVLAFMMPGDSCDLHIGLLAQMDHNIQTVTRALVATVERENMDALMERHPGIARSMYVAQLVDEGALRAWITSMGRRSSIERVAHLVSELYIRASNVGLVTGHPFCLPLPQLLLSEALGITVVHLNRVLRDLRLGGSLSIGRGQLVIEDPVKLIQFAGFNENYLHRRTSRSALPTPAM